MANEDEDDFMRLFTGKTLASADLGKFEPTVTIRAITIEEMENDKKKGADGKPLKEAKWLVHFEGKDKAMVFNKTNCLLCEGIFGTRNPKKWIGRSITLGVRKVKFGPDLVDGIRVIGSPELAAPITVAIKMRKKAQQDVVLKPTGTPAAGKWKHIDDGRAK